MSGDVPAPAAPLLATLTPNPSIDLLFAAGQLVWDDANRLPRPRRRAGGQAGCDLLVPNQQETERLAGCSITNPADAAHVARSLRARRRRRLQDHGAHSSEALRAAVAAGSAVLLGTGSDLLTAALYQQQLARTAGRTL